MEQILKPDSSPGPFGVAAARGARRIFPRPGLHFAERRLLLALIDLAIVNGAFFLTRLHHFDSVGELGLPNLLRWCVLLSMIWLACGFVLDCYDLTQAANSLAAVLSTGGAAVVATLTFQMIPFVTPALPTGRLEALLPTMVTGTGIAIWRGLYAGVLAQPAFHRRALILGAGPSGRALVQLIRHVGYVGNTPTARVGYDLLGFVDSRISQEKVADLPVLGGCADLGTIIAALQPDEIIVASTFLDRGSGADPGIFSAVLLAQELGVEVTTMPLVYERLTGRLALAEAGERYEAVLSLSRGSAHRPYLIARRICDIAAALAGCLLLAALIPFIWVGNRLTSPGPLFYFQERVGQGGRTFRVVKFRSMIVDAEGLTGAVWATERDPRITRLGGLLRKTRLDEVPQCWNVLKGEMSMIGPRPERPQFVAHLQAKMPFYGARHIVRPGLTGWAQVNYRYGASDEDAWIKLQYDLYFTKYQRPYLDLLILLKTIRVVLGFKGR